MILDFFNENFQPSVAALFNSLKKGAHKADLFRYAMLYINGGLYLDIKTELIAPLDWVFADKTSVFFVRSNISRKTMYNGIIAGPSRQHLFLEMVKFMVDAGADVSDYHYNIRHLYQKLEPDCNSSWIWSPDKCLDTDHCVSNGTSYRFAIEEGRGALQCYDGRDRYGFCAFVTGGCEKIFKVRYSDYP
jgi:hypothetical protein